MTRTILIGLLALATLDAQAETMQVSDLEVSRVLVMGSAEVEITQASESMTSPRCSTS